MMDDDDGVMGVCSKSSRYACMCVEYGKYVQCVSMRVSMCNGRMYSDVCRKCAS